MRETEEIFKKYNADAILLQNCDDFTLEHTANSRLHKITGFSGSAGEAILKKDGKIYLFVDPRYHIEAANCVKKNVEVVKMQMRERFLDILPKYLDKNAKLLIDEKFITLDFFNKIKSEYKNIIEGDFEKRCAEIPFEIDGLNKVKPLEANDFDLSKIKNLQKKLNAKNILIVKPVDVSYLTGKRCFKMQNSSSVRAKMLIENDKITFFTAELPEIKKETVVFSDNLTLGDFKKLKNPVLKRQNAVSNMMSIKGDDEIEAFKKVFKATDLALLNFRKQIKTGQSELELKNILENEMKKAGALSTSFKTILSIGENTASIHYSSYDKNKILKNNDLILVDCGIYLKEGYASDITRVFCAGKPNKLQKEVYTLVLKAFLNVYNKNFETGEQYDTYARKIFKKAPSGFNFSHALGHGVGLNVHSAPPVISPKSDKKIKNNMVFTLEPGLYKENEFGIRLENTVYLDKSGEKISLSDFPFESKLIDMNMLNKQEQKWLRKWL